MPVAQCTSVAFGGRDYDELYITTGQEGFPPGGFPDQPHAGGVFRCHQVSAGHRTGSEADRDRNNSLTAASRWPST